MQPPKRFTFANTAELRFRALLMKNGAIGLAAIVAGVYVLRAVMRRGR
jgi:hypothetical protein